MNLLLLALVLTFSAVAHAQAANEVLLSDSENAYNPIPSPDGSLIAYVRTGWHRYEGDSGFGRSNLRSELATMSASGGVLTRSALADAFLLGWTSDGHDMVGYRDGHYLLVSQYGSISKQAEEAGGGKQYGASERVAYLAKSDTFVWVEHRDSPQTVILTQNGVLAQNPMMTGNLVIPSPDERYIAVTGNGMDLWVYDRTRKRWANLGNADIHPDTEWDYIKPSWNPWFADSSRLAFFSGSALVVVSPDGQHRRVLTNSSARAGLATPAPDGKHIAYATFVPRPIKVRPDLSFFGGTILWTIDVDGDAKPQQVTSTSEDTTYDLRWLGNERLVFDRIADAMFYSHARLWTVTVPPTTK